MALMVLLQRISNMIKSTTSYLFFFFLVFSLLSIVVSESTQTFSQLFFFFSKNGLAYDFILKILYFCIWALSIYYVVMINLKDRQDISKLLVASFIAFVFLFIWVFSLSFSTKDFMDTLHLHSYEIFYLDFFELVSTKFLEILGGGFFYLFFTLLPFLFLICDGCFDLQKSLHRFAYKFFPSMYVCILFLIAHAMQPYYDKSNLYFYVDLLLFALCLILLLVLFLKHKHLFGFYEYANLLFLCLVIFVVLLCSSVLARADYHNLRYCLYLLAFLIWCCEWMLGDLIESA